jgi:hypothetical protein
MKLASRAERGTRLKLAPQNYTRNGSKTEGRLPQSSRPMSRPPSRTSPTHKFQRPTSPARRSTLLVGPARWQHRERLRRQGARPWAKFHRARQGLRERELLNSGRWGRRSARHYTRHRTLKRIDINPESTSSDSAGTPRPTRILQNALSASRDGWNCPIGPGPVLRFDK